jgi:hypothetical protein
MAAKPHEQGAPQRRAAAVSDTALSSFRRYGGLFAASGENWGGVENCYLVHSFNRFFNNRGGTQQQSYIT